MAFIEAKNGPQMGHRYDLPGHRSVLGRHPDCHVVVDVGAVSRHHAQIVRDGGTFSIEDLNSRNGTYVNNKIIRGRFQLSDGDVLRVCDVEFAFQSETNRKGANLTLDFSDSSSPGSVVIDDHQSNPSTIMSKLDISSGREKAQFSTSPEAKLKALIEIVHDLSKVLSLDAVLPRVLESLFRIFMQADRGFVVLKNDDGTLVPMWSKFRREEQADMVSISRTVINLSIDGREAILSADAATDERFDLSQSVADFRIRSMMCAPLLDGEGNAFGVIQVDTLDQRKRFQAEDLEVLATVALQAGIAIDNAKLHEKAVAQAELQRDLEVAYDVQRGFLPKGPPMVEGFEFYDYYKAAQHIGGDYYDYVALPDGRVAVIVADVVGHGIPAALLMAKLSAESRFALASQPDLATAMRSLNNAIARLDLDVFITAVLGVITPIKNTLLVANAGHYSPLLLRTNSKIEEPGLTIGGLPLGIAEDIDYEVNEVELKAGDQVVMFTDGIIEVRSPEPDDQEFQVDRVKEIIQEMPHANPNAIGEKLIGAVQKHAGSRDPDDDMCLVCFGR